MADEHRVQSLDALRGLVMIIMALDHVRDYFHSAAMAFSPEDLARTTAAVFFTRWVTHLCAPVFAFTAGLGAFLWLGRARTTTELSRFLWKRGAWLLVLEVTVVRFGMFFSMTSGSIILTVLWALGWSMVALGFLVRLRFRTIAVISLTIILLHNLTDPIPAQAFGSASWLWNILHQQGAFTAGGLVFVTGYPILPWIGVMAAGFAFGPVLQMESQHRKNWLLGIGLGLTTAFIGIRLVNVYGDPQPWSVQGTAVMTLVSFLRTTKYPPSLLFVLMTIGPAMLIWRWLDDVRFGDRNPMLVFGRVPLFYFVAHLYLIHALTYLFAFFRYGTVGFLVNPLPSMGGTLALYPPGFGYDLPAVYAQWLLVVALMYPLCLYFGDLKRRRKSWWLSYM